MPEMVRMRATPTMTERMARQLQYRTRMMTADILGGQEFELSSSDARTLRRTGWAENVEAPAPAPKRRGRPPKTAAAAEEPEPAETAAEPAVEDPLADRTVPELREMAEARGIELPAGYIRHDELVAMLRETGGDR